MYKRKSSRNEGRQPVREHDAHGAGGVVDLRPATAGRRALQALADASTRRFPVQRRIDDPAAQETVRALVREIFGAIATPLTVATISAEVIDEANSVDEARPLIWKKKVQRGAFPASEKPTGKSYDPTRLADDKLKAMERFRGLPGHTNPDVADHKDYFTWHHIVPQSHLPDKETASKTAAVRLGPSASHRYGDPGNDFTDPNFAAARDGTLTPDSESIEAYLAAVKNGGGLARLLGEKISALALQIQQGGNVKPLADPGQWLIFGDVLRSLPGMTPVLKAELDALIGPGYTHRLGQREMHQVANWADLKQADGAGPGTSPALFAVLDAGIKAYQKGQIVSGREDNKIFLRGYRERNPVVIDSLRRKDLVDSAWFSVEGAGPNAATIMAAGLGDAKATWGKWIVRGTRMLQKAEIVARSGEEATKSTGDVWRGTSHAIAAGSGSKRIDQTTSETAAGVVTSLSSYHKELTGKLLIAHQYINKSAPNEDSIFVNYAARVPKPAAAEIGNDAVAARMAARKPAIAVEVGKRREHERKAPGAKGKAKKAYEDVDKAYKDRTKALAAQLDGGEAEGSLLWNAMVAELAEEEQTRVDAAHRNNVIADFKEKQDDAITRINTAGGELNALQAAPVGPADEQEAAHMPVTAFCATHIRAPYRQFEAQLRDRIARQRFLPPAGATMAEVTDAAWEAAERAYSGQLARMTETAVQTLRAKIEALGAEMKKTLHA